MFIQYSNCTVTAKNIREQNSNVTLQAVSLSTVLLDMWYYCSRRTLTSQHGNIIANYSNCKTASADIIFFGPEVL